MRRLTLCAFVDTSNLTGYAQVVEEIVVGDVSKQYTYGHDLISQRRASTIGRHDEPDRWKEVFVEKGT